MPSAQPLPTIRDLQNAFHAAVGSQRKNEDSYDGSFYDRWGGVGALCMRRLAERDQGEARAIFFDTATDDRLDEYIARRFGAARIVDAPGVGTSGLTRLSAAAGAGTVLQGTRIAVGQNLGQLSYWLVAADTPVGASGLSVTVPMHAVAPGPAGQISVKAGDLPVLQLADPLWDNTWQVASLDCAAGTTRQQDPAVRAAIRQARFDSRPGYPTAIIAAMVAAGATVVALYASDFLGSSVDVDVGLNRIYVGDAGYESPMALLTACRLAVSKVCVAGTSVQVLPMTNFLLYVNITVNLWASPEKLNRVQAQSDAVAAVTEYFARRDNAFLWSERAMRAAVMKAVPNVHSVTLTASDAGGEPVTEPLLSELFDSVPLQRYRVADWTVGATVLGPS